MAPANEPLKAQPNPRRFGLAALLSILVLSLLAAGLVWWLRCPAPTTLLIVRHADRAGASDALNDFGTARAHELVHLAQHAHISAIYHSDTVRARETAAPLANALGLVPVERPGNAASELVKEILATHGGSTVVVVGHSNTVPEIIAEAGGPRVPAIADDEFDRLFVLSCGCSARGTHLIELQYGAPSQ